MQVKSLNGLGKEMLTVVAVVAFEMEGGYTWGAATTWFRYALDRRDVKNGFVSERPSEEMMAGSEAMPSPQFMASPFCPAPSIRKSTPAAI